MNSVVLSTIKDLERKAGNHIEPEPATNLLLSDLFMTSDQLPTFCLNRREEVDYDIKHEEDID